MFKVGDIIKRKDAKIMRYKILEFRFEYMVVETATENREEVSQYTIGMGDKLYDIWEVDKQYYRKQKLKKICSKLEI